MPDLAHLLAPVTQAAASAGGGLRAGLRWGSEHTGLPVVVVAAVALVVSLRILRRTVGFAIEVIVATAILLAATELGLLRW